MDRTQINSIHSRCEHFLSYHRPCSLREHLRTIADSEYCDVGRDAYGQGGFVAQFESEIASLLGKEAAVFMPSGTMAQQIALRIWADRSGVPMAAFHRTCHLELREENAFREMHRLDAVLLGTSEDIFHLVEFEALSQPISTLLIELPQREIGGILPTWEELSAICSLARERGIHTHLDGARLWECGPYYGRSYAEVCALFDSVYVSFYKILSGLPGAALAGPADFIAEARPWLRRHGGNLQQQTPSAISAKLGMDRHLPRIPEYVAKAAEIAVALNSVPGVRTIPPEPKTNLMHIMLPGEPESLVKRAMEIAEQERVFLFGGLIQTPEGSRTELSVGDGALGLSGARVADLFERLLQSPMQA